MKYYQNTSQKTKSGKLFPVSILTDQKNFFKTCAGWKMA